jgi:hypothetical protein
MSLERRDSTTIFRFLIILDFSTKWFVKPSSPPPHFLFFSFFLLMFMTTCHRCEPLPQAISYPPAVGNSFKPRSKNRSYSRLMSLEFLLMINAILLDSSRRKSVARSIRSTYLTAKCTTIISFGEIHLAQSFCLNLPDRPP